MPFGLPIEMALMTTSPYLENFVFSALQLKTFPKNQKIAIQLIVVNGRVNISHENVHHSATTQ